MPFRQKLWEYKSGLSKKEFTWFGKEQLDRGKALEPLALAKLARYLGRPLEPGMFWHRDCPAGRLGASPDGIFYFEKEQYYEPDQDIYFEIPAFHGRKELAEAKAPQTLDSVEEGNKKHCNYAAQQYCQMFCSEATTNHLIIYVANGAALYSRTPFDSRIWERCFLPTIEDFCKYLIAQQKPPRSFTIDHYELNDRFAQHVRRNAFTKLLPG